MSKKLFVVMSLLLVVAMLAACAPAAAPATTAPAAQQPAATGAKPYIPVISKGFQHQFWQAVKLGAQNAAKDLNVDITFEGPETEAMVDKQVEMFQTALDKKPAAICLAAVDSKAFIPLLREGQSCQHPGDRFRLRRGQRHPRVHRVDGQHRGCGFDRGQDGVADRRIAAKWPSSRTTRPAAPASIA